MRFINLNQPEQSVDFETALWEGVAKDSGLYFPSRIPELNEADLANLQEPTLQEVAEVVLTQWLGDDLPAEALHGIVQRAFTFEIPVREVGPYMVTELFHGPTLAFKDVAARFLAQCLQYYAKRSNRVTNILVATSGDTGGAIANAFGGLENIRVFVLFPKGRVSVLQYEQLTRVAPNVVPIEVEGVFDDCQALVKQALSDPHLTVPVSSANSINVGRLLPQITYYAYTYLTVGKYQAVVPTGNLGNATAGALAAKMGPGPTKITLACNANNALARFAQTGKFEGMQSVATLSNAMDVGNPNNFPRFFHLFGGSLAAFTEMTEVCTVTDQQTVETIQRVYKEYDYLLDPHTAVGWKAAEQSSGDLKKVIFSTASPLKFAEEITRATGIAVDNTELIAALQAQPARKQGIENDYDAFSAIVREQGLR